MTDSLTIEPYDLEDDLWESTLEDSQARTRVYRPTKPIVVLGRGSKPELELELDACTQDGIPLLRRRGGGCSVVLDQGNVIVAHSQPMKGFGDNLKHFKRLNQWVIDGLGALGISGVSQAGISDLVFGERKVGGTCIYRARNVLLYSASLLVSPRIELIERYLKHPPREPDYRRGRAHSDFVASLSAVAGAADAQKLVDQLDRALSS